MGYIIIETTFAKRKEAEEMAKKLIKNKLAACVQISEVDSYYSWKGKIENSKEYNLSIKTLSGSYGKVETIISKNHSYVTPEIIALKIKKGSKNYLNWMKEVLR